MTDGELAYLTPEAKARIEIDRMLAAAGWAVQDARAVNLSAAQGVAVREFVMRPPHGRADYLLFLDGAASNGPFSGELVPQDPADEPAETLLARIRAERGGMDTRKGHRTIK